MKTKSFILTLVALIAFAGNAWAQTWIGSEVSEGYALLYNVGTGKYLTRGNGWDTQASVGGEGSAMTVYLQLFDGKYKIRTLNSKGLELLDNAETVYTDQSINKNSTWTFSEVDATNHIYNIISADNHKGGSGVYLTAEGGSSTIVGPGSNGTNDNAKWKVYIYTDQQTKLLTAMENASETSPLDVSMAFIKDANFGAYNDIAYECWTMEASNKNLNGGNLTNPCAESWRATFTLSQTIEGLPNGYYQVRAQAALTDYDNVGSNYPFVYADNKQVDFKLMQNNETSMAQLSERFGNGEYWTDWTESVIVSTGSLTIGAKCTRNNTWSIFDNFQLRYLGPVIDLSEYETQLAGFVEAANALNGLIPTAAYNEIQSVVANYNKTYSTATDYEEAIAAINNAISTYGNSDIQTAYANFIAYKETIVALSTGQEQSQALSDFNTTLNSITSNVNATTTVAAINDQITALRSAGLTYISTADGRFDITFLATQNWQEWRRYNGNPEGTNAGLLSDNFLHNRPAEIPSFPEYWVNQADYTGKQLWQTVSGLPQGFYQISMYAGALSTSQRDGFPTEASDGDSDRSFAFAGDENDASSIMRTGIPIKFATEVDFSELTILDVNVHLTGSDNSNNLTFGITKDSNGSNWHFAQIASIIYSNQPDLTQLEATRDALVAEAQGILNRDGGYLTDAQKTALQTAIAAGNNANTFDDLNTVTLTTLPNAINTAKQQVAQAKVAIPVLHQALERFEKDYNLVDGTDYQRVAMSAKAWTDLLAKVNAATLALDDISQAPQFATIAAELNDQMDATDVSIRLFKSYKAMVQGCQSLNITEGDTYAADSYMDTDEKEMEAIAALNTAFITYREGQSNDVDMAGFLGDNLDFSATQGDLLVTGTLVYDLVGWEENYSDVQANERIQTNADNHNEELYLRSNWTDKNPVLEVAKLKMLPVGDYQLSLSWNSNMQNMINHSKFVLGETGTTIGETTSGTLTYDFTVGDAATDFDLILGFQKQNSGNSGAEIIVDNIQLICLAGTPFQRAYDAAEAANDDTDATAAAKSAVTEYAQYDGNEGGLLTEGERGDAYWQAVNVLRNAKAIADASGDATDLVVNADLTNTNKNGNFPMGWTGTYEGDNPGGNAWIGTQDGEQVFNIWAANITLVNMMQAISNLPKGAYRLSMDMGTNNLPDNGDGAPVFNFINPVNMDIGASELVTADNTGEHRNFETYTSAAEVGDAHQLTIGVRSEGHYFQMKNIHLEYIGNAATAAAETDASYVRQDFFWQNKDAGVVEFFFDGEKYENAQNVKVYPTGVNIIIHGLPGEFAASVPNADNGGTCENLIITDGHSLVNTKAFNATTASYTRNMSGSSLWGTLIMPFPLTSNDDIQYYTFNQFVEGEEETVMAFVPADEVPANTPVVYKKKDSEATSVTATGSGQVALTTGNQGDAMTLSGWNLIGVYEPTTIERNGHTPDGDGNYYYYIASNKFWKLNSDDKNDLTVAPFRAYFMTTNDVDLSSTQSIKIRVMDDDATGIIDLNDGIEICGDIYTVGGQLVRKNAHNFEGLQRGVYIVGGKKVVIK